MIEFTIKTLDSNNHHFSVDDELTVEELKEKVREQMGIEPHLQRLIFCGRVMQDEKKLKDYAVRGKVVHLVQRAPPDLRQSAASSNDSNERGERAERPDRNDRRDRADRNGPLNQAGIQQQVRRLMSITSQPDYPETSQSPTAGRLEFIRRVIVDIKSTLAQLRAHVNDEENSGAPASSEAPAEPVDNEPTAGATQEEPEPVLDDNGDEVADPLTRAQNSRRRSYRAIRALRARYSRPRDLAQLIDELDALQEQFVPYRNTFVRILRDANDTVPPEYTEEEREHNQRIVEMASDVMHSFGHAYHCISDLTFQVGERNPLLDAPSSRGPVPVAAQINVVQNRPPPPAQQVNNDHAAGGAAQRGPGNEASANVSNSAENQSSSAPASAGRNTTQPTVNINIQPDPITYQVEIETRVPIAIPIDNALLNGISNAANATNAQQTEPAQQQATAQGQGGATPAQANRRQVLFDFENIFGGIGQGANAGGVEVVMSVEELVRATNRAENPGAAAGPPGAITLQPAGAVGVAHHDGGVYLAPMPWGGAPSAELLQSIATTLVRQGLLPGIDSVALHVPGLAQAIQGQLEAQVQLEALVQAHTDNNETQNQTPAQNQAQAQNNTQVRHAAPTNDASTQNAQAQDQASAQNRQTQNEAASQNTTSTPNAAPVPTVAPAPNAAPPPNAALAQANAYALPLRQSQRQSASRITNPPRQILSDTRTTNLHLRRAAAARPHAMLANFMYDRFLHCDSIYARRRIQRRRDQYQQQLVAQERIRVDRVAAVNLTSLRERNTSMTEDYMNTMLELLGAEPSAESWYNALMVAVARNLFIPEPLQMIGGEPALVPSEFQQLRMQLRSYVQDLLNRSNSDGENAFEGVADFILNENSEFINNMRTYTPIFSEVDVVGSIRMLIRSRLPAVVATVMSDSPGETFAPRFYGVFSRFFIDACALITLCCRDGILGLRVLYTAYVEEIVQDFEEPIRDMLLSISIDNLNGIMPNLRIHANNIRQFIQLRPRPSAANTRRPIPMEQSPSPPVRDEPMPMSMSNASPQAIHLEAERDETPFEHHQFPMVPPLVIPPGANIIVATAEPVFGPVPPGIPVLNTFETMDLTPEPEHDNPTPADLDTTPTSDTAPAPTPAAAPAPAETAEPTHTSTSPSTRASCSSRGHTRASDPVKSDSTQPPRTTTDPPQQAQQLRNPVEMTPEMLLQHWAPQWIPVLMEDQRMQRDETAEPYSDAYISGMPSRKRRCVRESRPPTTLEGFINESVCEATERPATTDNSAIRTAFREHMRNMARNRASNSDDYDPLRYASAARFLNPSRTSKQQQPESSSESKEK